jgi:hypothetical protein
MCSALRSIMLVKFTLEGGAGSGGGAGLDNLRSKISQIVEVYEKTLLTTFNVELSDKMDKIATGEKAVEITRQELVSFIFQLTENFTNFAIMQR